MTLTARGYTSQEAHGLASCKLSIRVSPFPYTYGIIVNEVDNIDNPSFRSVRTFATAVGASPAVRQSLLILEEHRCFTIFTSYLHPPDPKPLPAASAHPNVPRKFSDNHLRLAGCERTAYRFLAYRVKATVIAMPRKIRISTKLQTVMRMVSAYPTQR